MSRQSRRHRWPPSMQLRSGRVGRTRSIPRDELALQREWRESPEQRLARLKFEAAERAKHRDADVPF